MANIKFIIFDHNGTLTNDAIIGYKSCNHMLKFYGVPTISFERFRETFIIPWIKFYLVNGVPQDKINIRVHQKKYQRIYTSIAKKELSLNEGVKETLKFLKSKDVVLGVLSNRNISDLNNELNRFSIRSIFDVIVGENTINEDGIRAEKRTQIIIDKLSIKDTAQVLYVGDMITDIRIAREYGFISGVVLFGWQSKDKLLSGNPDYIFKKFTDIKKLFK